MRYEHPTIVARERIAAMLDSTTKSDPPRDGVGASDVHIKENIHPVMWVRPAQTVDYAKPGIEAREPLDGLLDTAPSDTNPDTTPSDVHVKEHIHLVVWGESAETVDYAKPGINAREPIAGLLNTAPSDKNDSTTSDVHKKEHIHPVTWSDPATDRYAKPAIEAREGLTALLTVSGSDKRDAQP